MYLATIWSGVDFFLQTALFDIILQDQLCPFSRVGKYCNSYLILFILSKYLYYT